VTDTVQEQSVPLTGHLANRVQLIRLNPVIIMTRPTPCIMCVHRQHLFASVDLHDC
jgi:hypothetical protein